jgi:hypothetical protein
MAIEQWPASERPRERLYATGAGALADAELLALQLGSGRRGQTAVEVAREMLASYGCSPGSRREIWPSWPGAPAWDGPRPRDWPRPSS